jgi:hypothetical protein
MHAMNKYNFSIEKRHDSKGADRAQICTSVCILLRSSMDPYCLQHMYMVLEQFVIQRSMGYVRFIIIDSA